MSKHQLWWPLLGVLALLGTAPALEVAIVPPVGDEPVAKAVRAAAADIGVTVAVLEPAQLLESARFSPSIYGLVILVGGEHYPDTVIDEGDAAAGLQAYVDRGGALLVACSGLAFSRPQRWNGSEWKSVPAPLRRMQLLTRFGLLDAGQPLESAAPAGSEFAVTPDAGLGSRLPQKLAVPAGATPFRPIPSNQDAAIKFLPLATLVDPQGGTYGAGVAEMKRADSRGSVFYVWSPLLTGASGRDLLLGILALHASESATPELAVRRDELLGQIQQLEKIHKQAAVVLPADLHNDEVDGLRKRMAELSETLRWLREACQAGNLNFVALRLQKVREDILELPGKVGQAVDHAVTDAVANPAGPRSVVPLEPPRENVPARTGESSEAGPVSSVVEPPTVPLAARPTVQRDPDYAPRAEPRPRPAPKLTGGATAPPREAPGADLAPAPTTQLASRPVEPAAPPVQPRSLPKPAPRTALPAPSKPEQPITPRTDQITPLTTDQTAPPRTTQPAGTRPVKPVTPPDKPATPVVTPPDKPVTPVVTPPDKPATPVVTPPDKPATPVVTPPDKPATPVVTPPDKPVTPGQPITPKVQFDTPNPVVELEIKNRGSVFIELLKSDAPKTCSAFLYLLRNGFYVNTYFHRRVPRFVVQGGDPLSKTKPPDDGEVGTGGPDFTVPGEFSDKLTHLRGTVGLARAPHDPDSGGSQFYICLDAQPTLDRDYAVFGKVIAGMDIVDRIQVGDRVVATRVVQGTEANNPAGAKPLELFAGQAKPAK